jgi:hypothetical protein
MFVPLVHFSLCLCVQSSIIITDPAVCSHDLYFNVSMCICRQQSLQHLLADSVCVQPTPEGAEYQFYRADDSLEETQPSLCHCGEQFSASQCPTLEDSICTVSAACVLEYWSYFRYNPKIVAYLKKKNVLCHTEYTLVCC